MQAANDTQQVFKKVSQLNDTSKFGEAEQILLQYISENPKDAEALAVMVHNLVRRNKIDVAQKFHFQALEINNKLDSVIRNEIRLLLKQGHLDDALKIALNLNKRSPNKHENRLVLASALATKNQFSDALNLLDGAIHEIPNHTDALMARAMVYARLNRLPEALDDITLVTSIKPSLSQGWILLAKIYKASNDLESANRAIKSAIELEPNNTLYLVEQAKLFTALGELDEGIRILNTAIELEPSNVGLWLNIAEIRYQKNDILVAKQAYEQVLDIDKVNVLALGNLGIIEKELGHTEQALIYFDKVLKIAPENAEAHNNMALCLKDLGRLAEARKSILKALDFKPTDAKYTCNLGSIYNAMGQLTLAEKCFKNAVAQDPNLFEAHNNLGFILSKLDRSDEAYEYQLNAIKLKPDSADAYNNMGNILDQLGQINNAEQSYKKAISLNPKFDTANENLGKLYLDQGRILESVHCFQKSLSIRSKVTIEVEDELAPAINDIFFELTNKCNFHCTFCPSDFQTRKLGSMNFDLVKRLYDETAEKKLSSTVNLHLMGEPTLHPKLIEILDYGASKNIKTILVTNGSTLVEKVVPKILSSLYGEIVASHMTATEDSYHLRGKVGLSWERYINNIRLLVRQYLLRISSNEVIKNKVIIRVMVTQNTASNASVIESESEAKEILKEWSDYVSEVEKDLGLKPFKRADPAQQKLLKDSDSAYTMYSLQDGVQLQFWKAFTFANTRVDESYILEDLQQTAYCPHPFTDLGVLWNGDVTLCALDHDGHLKVGNIKDTPLEQLIQGPEARKLRACMLGDGALPNICKTCQAKPVKRD